MNVNIITLNVFHELLCGASFDKGYAGISIVRAKEDVKYSATADNLKEILVSGTVGQILCDNSSLLSAGIMLPLRFRRCTARAVPIDLQILIAAKAILSLIEPRLRLRVCTFLLF